MQQRWVSSERTSFWRGELFFAPPCTYSTYNWGQKKRSTPKTGSFWRNSSLLHKHEFSLIFPLNGGKITRGIQIFYQNFCYSSLLVPILLLVFMRKSAKPPCVHTNPNYHQGTPGPPEWAEIIDLMMFSPAKKTDSKIPFCKKSCVYSKITKYRKKARF